MQHTATVTFPEESLTRSRSTDFLCLAVFAAFLCFWGIGSGPALSDHEAIVAQAARQIRQGDGWLIPKVGADPFIQKPPLAFWLAALCSYGFEDPSVMPPVSELAARLPSALAAFAISLFLYLLGRSMMSHRIGLLAGAIYATCASTLFFSHNAQVEMVQTALATVCFASFWAATNGASRRTLLWIAFYVALALAMLAKMPQPLATVGLPLAVWWLVVIPLFKLDSGGSESADAPQGPLARALRQIRCLPALWLIPGIPLFLAVFLPWPVLVWRRMPDVLKLWEVEFLDRYTGEIGSEGIPVVYYVPFLFALTIPFCLSIPEALAAPFLRFYRDYRRPLLFALTWALVQVVFLSFSAFKRPRYILGSVPALALLLAPVIERLFLAGRTFAIRNVRMAVSGILGVIGAGLIGGGAYVLRRYPEQFWMLPPGAGLLFGGLLLSCLAFLRGRRLLSLLALHATTAAVFAWGWTAMGQGHGMQWAAHAMIRELDAHAIGPEDKLTWVSARPDAALMFYLGRPIAPMLPTLEMAARRGNRKEVSRALLEEAAGRLLARLESRNEEYFIIRGGYWDQFRLFKPPAREVFRVVSRSNPGEDDYVVITNDWNTGEQEDRARDARAAVAPNTSGAAPAR